MFFGLPHSLLNILGRLRQPFRLPLAKQQAVFVKPASLTASVMTAWIQLPGATSSNGNGV
jgi:hypothetical protein